MNNITINELIATLNKLPNEAKKMQIKNICGCRNYDIVGFQIQLICEDKKHDKYVIIPYNKNDIAYDSFGKREILDLSLNALSLTQLVTDAGYGEYICTSFEEAENNNRQKNIVINYDKEIYLTYKHNNKFGEFVCWVKDEFLEDDSLYDSVIDWVEYIYSRTEEEIDEAIENNSIPWDFKIYNESELELN